MNKCIIFLSRKENYLGSAIKIKNSTKMKIEIIYIEDFIKNNENINDIENSIVYFLCNSFLIKELIIKISKLNCYVFNEKFFEKNYTKYEIQKILINNKITVPNIIDYKEIKQIKYPVFCKENKHAGIIFQAYTCNTMEKFFEKFEKEEFYIEESIRGQQEIKYYYVKGKVYCKENSNIPHAIIKNCKSISRLLNLEVFSTDIIRNKKNYTIIDVNPAAGFYLLEDARNTLIKEFQKLEM